MYKKIIIGLMLIVMLTSVQATWWDSDFTYRKEINIQTDDMNLQANVTADHTLFVNIDNTHTNFWGNIDFLGNEMRIVAGDDTTELDFNKYTWDYASNDAVIRIEVTDTFTSASTTDIYLYYGKAGAANAEDGTGIFPSTYTAVWDFDGASPQAYTDMTANGYDLSVTQGNPTEGETGKLDETTYFGTGVTEAEETGNGTLLDGELSNVTFIQWIKRKNGYPASGPDWELNFYKHQGENTLSKWTKSTGKLGWSWSDGSGDIQSSKTTWTSNQWYFIAHTVDTTANQMRMYVDGYTADGGIDDGSTLGTIDAGTNYNLHLADYWGNKGGEQSYDYMIVMDSTTLTADEIQLLYYNQSDTDTYVTLGAEQTETSVTAAYSYTRVSNRDGTGTINLIDESTANNVTIDDWDWLVDGSQVNVNEDDYNYATTSTQDLNVCLEVTDSTDAYTSITCKQFNTGDMEAPDSNVSITDNGNGTSELKFQCWDSNSGCDSIRYQINSDTNVIADISSGTYDVNISKVGTNTLIWDTNDLGHLVGTNWEDAQSTSFTTYGSVTFTFFDEETDAGTSATLDFNGTDYTGTNFVMNANLIAGATNTTKTFEITKTNTKTRYYTIDMNYFSTVDVNFAILNDTNGADIEMLFYDEAGTSPLTNTYITAKQGTHTIGRRKTDPLGEVTFAMDDLDINYTFFVDGDYNTGMGHLLINRPANFDTGTDIDGNWMISLTGITDRSNYKIQVNSRLLYIIPNKKLDYLLDICMLTAGLITSATCDTGTYGIGNYSAKMVGDVDDTILTINPLLSDDMTETLITVQEEVTESKLGLAQVKIYTTLLGTELVASGVTDEQGQLTLNLEQGHVYYVNIVDAEGNTRAGILGGRIVQSFPTGVDPTIIVPRITVVETYLTNYWLTNLSTTQIINYGLGKEVDLNSQWRATLSHFSWGLTLKIELYRNGVLQDTNTFTSSYLSHTVVLDFNTDDTYDTNYEIKMYIGGTLKRTFNIKNLSESTWTSIDQTWYTLQATNNNIVFILIMMIITIAIVGNLLIPGKGLDILFLLCIMLALMNLTTNSIVLAGFLGGETKWKTNK